MSVTHTSLAGAPRVAVVVSGYNASITDALLEGALRAYGDAGGEPEGVAVVRAPGAFELPVLARHAAADGRFRGVVALGCVVRGETSHDRYINAAVTDGLMRICVDTGVPVGYGLLTVDTVEQARERAGGRHGNKGEEAMTAVLQTIAAIDAMKSGGPVAAGPARPDKAAQVRASSAGGTA